MKKSISLILVLVLILALAAPAHAEGKTTYTVGSSLWKKEIRPTHSSSSVYLEFSTLKRCCQSPFCTKCLCIRSEVFLF